MSRITIKKLEEQLTSLELKQEILKEVITELNQQEERDLVNELIELKKNLLAGDIEIYGYKLGDFPKVDQDFFIKVLEVAISFINLKFDLPKQVNYLKQD